MIGNFINPLSFSSHAVVSLGDLVYQVLSQMGMGERLLKEFNQHSTIVLKFNEALDISISVSDDRLWVWSVLQEVDRSTIYKKAIEILSVISESVENVETGQLTWGESDQGYEIKALVNLKCLSQEGGFKKLIEDFYNKIHDLHDLIH
ncbi:hypothetical protein [Chromobacterium vaccinii]|uniref:InvB/SpaK family type III secretion system chaperone n=1 Tax=Chromobacterium vaccinii TaxID=1108595 RepID=UPI0031DA2592